MSDWASFYVTVGSSGAALFGMQFVVITLLADRRRRPTVGALNAFTGTGHRRGARWHSGGLDGESEH